MTREERAVLDELSALARDPEGRRLLQLALRGIQESGRGLTYGCWVKNDGGVSGCLFQHAYWQGVQEGVFAPAGDVKHGIKENGVCTSRHLAQRRPPTILCVGTGSMSVACSSSR